MQPVLRNRDHRVCIRGKGGKRIRGHIYRYEYRQRGNTSGPIMDIKELRIVIAGGGTGGHLFPGIAVAQEFISRSPGVEVIFVGTDRVFEKSILSEKGFRHLSISAEGIKGRSWWRKLLSIFKLPKGILESMWILLKFRPHLVVGVGGYSAGPVVMGAWLLRVKRVLHEQNILPGVTNRMLSRFSECIFVSFEQTKQYFKAHRVMVTGNPIRQDILKAMVDTQATGKREKPFSVFIIGGSQGAHSINMAVMDALDYIKNGKQYGFIHQTGSEDESMVKARYRDKGFRATVQPFFSDMATRFQDADLIICRAGATTVAEITALGKAAIFIPYPHAADNHQMLNARDLETAGAAEMISEQDLSGAGLGERIDFYASNPDQLRRMEKTAKEMGKPQAAKTIVDECLKILKIEY